MRGPATLLEAGLLAATAALGVVWLEIPDTTAAGKALSVALAVGWAVIFLWAQSAVLIVMRRSKLTRVEAWKGALLLGALGLVYWLVATFFDAGALQDAERAERWAAHTWVWHVAGVAALERAEAVGWWWLRWMVAGALLPMAIEGAARGLRHGWLRACVRPLQQWLYWVVVMGAAAAGTLVTRGLLAPRTGLPVVLEVLLVVVATGLVFAVDVGALCAVLALTSTYLRDGDRGRAGAVAEVPIGGGRLRRGRRERSLAGG